MLLHMKCLLLPTSAFDATAHLSLARQQQDAVHEAEDVGTRLVDGQHHRHAAAGQLRHQVNHLLGKQGFGVLGWTG